MPAHAEAPVPAHDAAAALPRDDDPGPGWIGLDRLETPVWVFDIDRARVRWANPSALAVWQAASLDELRARDMGADMSASVAQRLRQFQQDFVDHDAHFSELWTLYPRGEPRTLRVMYSGLRLSDGRMAMLCEGMGTVQEDAETLRSAEALLHTSVMITLYDAQGEVLYRNPAARDAVSRPTETLHEHFVDPAQGHQFMDQIQSLEHGRLPARVHTSRGERWHEVAARRCRDAVTGGDAWLLSEVDISELKRTEAHARHLALHDTLTGLPNRHFVMQDFQHRLEDVRREGREAALIFFDLDRFKHINDSLGHAAGDQLLVQMAQRLRAALRDNDLVARLGGDEFLVLASAPDIAPYAEALVQRLRAVVAQPIEVGGVEVCTTPSVGVCLFPHDGSDIDTLMRHADLAMYRAKERGRGCVAYFSTDMNSAVQTRLAMEGELRRALARDEFLVYYQPRVDTATGRILGAEALVRWQHPERGLVPPGEFIPVCEDSGLIREVGARVLALAARQQVEWQRRGMGLTVSVNLSPRQFSDPELLSNFAAITRDCGCAPGSIELEITESVLLGSDAATLDLLHGLRAQGFGISIDDFGTGYSNLAYLLRYPLQGLKIDRSFIREADEGRPITTLIIAMSRMLGLRVVAEGVETPEQLAWLHEHGCDEYQGFLFSPPVEPARFEALWHGQFGPPAIAA